MASQPWGSCEIGLFLSPGRGDIRHLFRSEPPPNAPDSARTGPDVARGWRIVRLRFIPRLRRGPHDRARFAGFQSSMTVKLALLGQRPGSTEPLSTPSPEGAEQSFLIPNVPLIVGNSMRVQQLPEFLLKAGRAVMDFLLRDVRRVARRHGGTPISPFRAGGKTGALNPARRGKALAI
jgi:hypothetical protein